MNFQEIQDEIAEWSDKEFGYGRPPQQSFSHLKEEVEELEGDPYDAMEYADCFMLLIDCARRANLTMDDIAKALRTKLVINRGRTWGKPDASGKVNHVRV